MTTVHIYLEASRIGSGWRTCEVRLGRKWAFLRECATDRRAKLPLQTYETLRRHEVKVRRRFRKPT